MWDIVGGATALGVFHHLMVDRGDAKINGEQASVPSMIGTQCATPSTFEFSSDGASLQQSRACNMAEIKMRPHMRFQDVYKDTTSLGKMWWRGAVDNNTA